MKNSLCFIALAAILAANNITTAAPKKPVKKSNTRAAPKKKSAPKKVATRVVKKAAPPSKATPPKGYYSSLAHQKAINLTKQAAEAFARGDYQKAVELSKTASDAYPTYARAQTWLGASYQKLGRYEEAAKAYKWAIALAPGTVDAERAERGLREIGE